MTIGKRLREERERLKLEQESVCSLAEMSRQSYGAYENDRSLPKADFLAKIASVGFDVSYIVNGVRLENTANTATELGYLRQCRLLATKSLELKGLEGLVFLRESNGIRSSDLSDVYQVANEPNILNVAQEPSTYKQTDDDDSPLILDLTAIR